MANVIDNESRKRANMMPVGIKVVDNKGNAVHTAKTDLGTNYISLEQKWFGSSSNNNGGNTDPDNPDHPAAGADYYAGSLADGEITERYLLYQRDETVAEQTGSQTVTLLRDVGTKFNMAGDGATFLLHLQKTVMTAGAKGAVSDVNLNYDTSNVAKEGYFTTTSVYPVYIKSADLATTNELDIPIDGIGENLQGGKNFLAPHLKVKFNGDGTMTYYSVTGYDNDGNSAGATGANYDVVVDVIATFSTQKAVAQLPASVNLFSGSAATDIALAGVSDSYENAMDGIEIFFDEYFYSNKERTELRTPAGPFVSGLSIRIPKKYLVDGYVYNVASIASTKLDESATLQSQLFVEQWESSYGKWGEKNASDFFGYRGAVTPSIKIGKSSITDNLRISIQTCSYTSNKYVWTSDPAWYWLVTKVSTYKD